MSADPDPDELVEAYGRLSALLPLLGIPHEPATAYLPLSCPFWALRIWQACPASFDDLPDELQEEVAKRTELEALRLAHASPEHRAALLCLSDAPDWGRSIYEYLVACGAMDPALPPTPDRAPR